MKLLQNFRPREHEIGWMFTFLIKNDLVLPPYCFYRQMAGDDGGWW